MSLEDVITQPFGAQSEAPNNDNTSEVEGSGWRFGRRGERADVLLSV
jgi:hypothetical protein